MTSIVRRDNREDGFTLVELMVVVLVVAILMAIAIPSYLGAQRSARNRAAQSDLRNALTAAKTIAADASPALFQIDGADVTAADMHAAEPSLSFDTMANADAATIGVEVASGGTVITLLLQSRSNSWFGIAADRSGDITYCTGSVPGDCDDALTDGYAAAAW